MRYQLEQYAAQIIGKLFQTRRVCWGDNRQGLGYLAILFIGILSSLVPISMVRQDISASGAPVQVPKFYPPNHAPILERYPPPEIKVPYSLSQLEARISRKPNDLMAHFYLMCLYAQQGKWEQSLRHALYARRLNNDNINIHLGIIYGYANLSHYQQAEDAIQVALKVPFARRDRSVLWRVRGDVALDRLIYQGKLSEFARALSAYRQALKLDSSNIQAMVGLAQCEIIQRSYAAAQQRLHQALSQVNVQAPGGRRKKALILYYLGIIEELQGQTMKAQEFYRKAKQTHPASFQSITHGQLLMWGLIASFVMNEQQDAKEKENKEAIAQSPKKMLSSRPVVVQYPPPEIELPTTLTELEQQVKEHPKDFMVHFYLMCGYAQQGQWQRCLKAALQAIQLDPSDVNVHLGIIYAYANLNQLEKALKQADSSLKHPFRGWERGALLRVRGDLLMDLYRRQKAHALLSKAQNSYRKVLETDRQNALALIGLARVEIEQKRFLSAKQYLDRVLKQVKVDEPGGRRKRALALYYLGMLEELQGNVAKAEALYSQALQMHPQSFRTALQKE